MLTIHMTVNECGIELLDNDSGNETLLLRVTGRAHDALLILKESIAMIAIDDDEHLPQRTVLSLAAGILQAAIREVDS